MSDSIEIRIEGIGVRRETVDIADLLDILRAVRATIAEGEPATPKKKGSKSKGKRPTASQRDVIVSLGSITDGSVTITLDAIPRARDRYNQLIGAIANDDPSRLSLVARANADVLSQKARLRGWTIGLQSTNGNRAVVAPDTPLFSSVHTRGRTSLVVSIVRVGGEDKRTAHVRLPHGQWLTATIATQDIAKQLGARLYQTIEVNGEAIWSSKDGTLLHFRIDGIGEYSESSSDPTKAIAELSKAADGFWDEIDPDVYVRESRSSEG